MSTNTKTIAGHPVGLFYLFATEFWERFSYYGMRALLVLYIVDEFFHDFDKLESKPIAYGIYGAYGALVYATPVIGGVIADKIIGYRKAILLGAILMSAGHFCMALPGREMFYIALGLLIVGNGFFKPNISALLGSLYKAGDPKRDGGFTIFYMGINAGAFFSPLVCGWLATKYGWHAGFGFAGIGMLSGLVVFIIGMQKNVFGNFGKEPEEYKDASFIGIPMNKVIYLSALLTVPVFSLLIFNREIDIAGIELLTLILELVGIVVLAKIFHYMYQEGKEGAQQILVVVFFALFSTIFWSFFEQAGTSLTIFADENVLLPSWCNAAQTQAINPLFIMIFAFPFAALWPALHRNELNPNTIVKCAIAMFLLGIGFIVFALSSNAATELGKVPFMYLVLGYFILTIGELSFSPIILSKTTELSPGKTVGFMLGAMMLSSSFAHHISGIIAKLTVPSTDTASSNQGILADMASYITGFEGGKTTSNIEAVQSLAASTSVFAQIGIVAILFGVAVLIISPAIKKLMHGVH